MLKDFEPGLDRLPDVSRQAAAEYSEQAETLVEHVNKAFKKREDVAELIGNNPQKSMFDNHENHAAFMANIFKLNNYKLLIRTVGWVYRTYHNHGFSYDYFLAELQSWQEAVERYLAPENAKEIKKIYSFMIEHHQDFIELAEEERENYGFDVPEKWEQTSSQFLKALLAGNHRKALDISREKVNSREDVEGFFEGVIRPSMYRVGGKWEEGEISVAEEHLASSIVSRVLSTIYTQFMSFEKTKGKAIITATANEFHEIGSRIIADSLELDGWDVDHLGVDTPVPDLVDLLRDKRPFMLGLSLAIPFNLDNLIGTVESIRAESELRDMKILVGGKAFNDNPELLEKTGADEMSQDCQQAVEAARDWWRRRN